MSSREPKTSIFITGVTGYIGGTVLAHLLKHSAANTFDISVLVRDSAKARVLKDKFGVRPIVATHDDHDTIEAAAAAARVVFNIANAGDAGLAKAILAGLKKRHATVGDLPILIHTSGTGVLVDDARGLRTSEVVYDDLDVAQLKSIPSVFFRPIDQLVIDADREGYARTHIVLPSTIYGVAQHELVDAGVSNAHSLQIPALIKAAFGRKRAGVVGEGKPFWPDVHIDDVADLYVVIFDAALRAPDTNSAPQAGHGWEGHYFGENGEHTWLQIGKAIGDALVELGIAADSTPTAFSTEELVKYFGSEQMGLFSGTNSRCRANRGRQIGWKAKKTTEDMLKSIAVEVEILWKQQRE